MGVSPHVANYTHARGLETDEAGAILGLFDGDFDGLLGKQVLDEFGPLHEAEAAGVDVVLVADVEHFLLFLDAVEVEVEDGVAIACLVFVDDGKRRGVDDVGHSQGFTHCLDECGLACSHLAVEGEDGVVAHLIDEFLCCNGDFIDVVYSYFHICCKGVVS